MIDFERKKGIKGMHLLYLFANIFTHLFIKRFCKKDKIALLYSEISA